MNIKNFFAGKLNRIQYWFRLLIVFVLFIIIVNLPGANQPLYNSAVWIPLSLLLIISVYYYSIIIRRLHDMDESGWYSLIALIPFVGTAFLFSLGIIKGWKGGGSV